jgi:undecaprenyl-diphosphatase
LSVIEAAILGLIQGLTEFLPISSTGHLTVAGKIMGVISKEHPEQWTAFIAVIQLGTLLAVLIYFRVEIWKIIVDFIKDNLTQRKKYDDQTLYSKLGWLIIIGSIPVGIIGLGFKDFIEGAFTKNLYVISGSLIIFALVLAYAEKIGKFKKDMKDITWKDALIIGTFQSLALIPGSSRSGSTITGGLFTGLKRDVAAKFSFLLGIPAILASGLLEFYQSIHFLDSDGMVNLIVATLVSAISGYFAIDFLLKYLKVHSTRVFISYRIAIALVILYLITTQVIGA